jgi:hypothetical protein
MEEGGLTWVQAEKADGRRGSIGGSRQAGRKGWQTEAFRSRKKQVRGGSETGEGGASIIPKQRLVSYDTNKNLASRSLTCESLSRIMYEVLEICSVFPLKAHPK